METITIKEVEDVIKKSLEEYEVLNTTSIYEKIEHSDNLKLVIFINKLFGEDEVILYTKLIFKVDSNKTKLIDNTFFYLYDINCQYVSVEFSDIFDLEDKIKDIFENNKFGPDLRALSDFIEKPAFLINEWLKKNKASYINVSNVKYDPKTYIMPCDLISFHFTMTVNNIEIPFNIIKESDFEYILSMRINNDVINLELSNLKNLDQKIGTILKNKIK